MKEQFTPWGRVWSVDDNGLTYKGKLLPYKELSLFNLVTAPGLITQGVIQTTHNNKLITLTYTFSDRVRAPQVITIVNEKINLAHGVKVNYKYRLVAHTGTALEVYDTYLIINFMSSSSHLENTLRGGGAGNKKINFKDLTSVTFKEPSGITVGFIQFSYPGSIEQRGGVMDAINDENSIPIQPSMVDKAVEIVNYIEKRRNELSKNNNTTIIQQGTSNADELLKFKQLLDAGVITEEEFNLKKKQLLGI